MKISSFDAEATVAVGRRIPEMLAVARLAADLARPIGASDVLRELLGPLPEVLGRRVLERCLQLGLLEDPSGSGEATLSEAGRIAMEQGEVLAPEEGSWRFFVINDPLVPAALVDLRRLQPQGVREERAAAKANPRASKDPTPARLRACEAAPPHPSIRNGQLFSLLRIAEQGERGPTGELTLSLTWEAAPSLRLSGALPAEGARAELIDAEVATPAALRELTYDELWRALASYATRRPDSVLKDWRARAGKRVVPASFAALAPAARRAFRQDLTVPALEIEGLGDFEETTLRDVALVPETERDAQEWLHWLQWEEIHDYVTPELLEAQAGAQLARFPHHRPRPARPAELLARARDARDARAWFLLGPSDLGLWGDA